MERFKEIRTSFWFYDFFGYLLPGFFFVCLLIIDYDLSTLMRYNVAHSDGLVSLDTEKVHFKMEYLFGFLTWNSDSDFKFTSVLIMLMFLYVLGHIIAAISSLLIERFLNYGLLKFPSKNLLDNTRERNWFQCIFHNYTRAFDDDFILKFKSVFEKRFGANIEKKDIFWLCFVDISIQSPSGLSRVSHFVSLYGFSRNIAGSLFIYIILRLLTSPILGSNMDFFNWGILTCFFICALIMTKNYLKFYYRQCSELFYHFYALHTIKNKD